jgi:hypothetical protein
MPDLPTTIVTRILDARADRLYLTDPSPTGDQPGPSLSRQVDPQ